MLRKVISQHLSDIKEKEERYTNQLANGVAQDFGSYRELVGTLKGLAYAREHLTHSLKNLEKDDDE